jgi:hypothetical protein
MIESATSARRMVAILWSLAAISLPARADDRTQLDACQALVDRAAPSAQSTAVPGNPAADAELQRCRQIIREWTLRDARRSVDEHGQPLR